MIYLQYFWIFKTGLLQLVEEWQLFLSFMIWQKNICFTSGQLADMIAVSESTPGPVVLIWLYVGFTTAGFGWINATLALVTPSVIIILIISYFKSIWENKYVDAAFTVSSSINRSYNSSWDDCCYYNITKMDLFKNSGSIMDLFNFKSLILAVIIYILSNIKQTKKLHQYFL